MLEFRVPEQIKPVITRILELDSKDYQDLLEALESAKPSLDIKRLADKVSAELSNRIEGAVEIVRALNSMNHARLGADQSVENFVQAIARSLESQFQDRSDKAESFRKISSLLKAQALLISARASDLQQDFDRVFISAKIVSDLRTVFDQSGDKIHGSMVVHNLNITYAQEGDFKSFYVAMDSSDIAKLRTVLDRADVKTSALRGSVKKAGNRYFE